MGRPGRSLLAAAALGLALQGSGCAAISFELTPDEIIIEGGEAVLPGQWQGKLPVVEVFLDGEGPYSFIVDTGASVGFVSPGVAAVHGEGALPLSEWPAGLDGGGRTVSISEWIPVRSLRMGAVELRMLALIVLDLDFLSETLGFRVDGVLGYSACSTGLLTLDYPRREVRFAEGELPAIDGKTILPLFDEGRPMVDLDWGGRPLRVMLDSGSNGSIALAAFPEGVEFLSGPMPGTRSTVLTRVKERESCARVRGVMGLGRYRVLDPILSISKGPPRIGTGVLGSLCLTLDAAHGKVRILGDTLEWREAPKRSTGASVFPSKGVFTVMDVLPGSPAEKAGVLAGDIVLIWNGIPADAEHQAELMFAGRKKGTVERMTIRRDGKDMEFEVPVVDIVP